MLVINKKKANIIYFVVVFSLVMGIFYVNLYLNTKNRILNARYAKLKSETKELIEIQSLLLIELETNFTTNELKKIAKEKLNMQEINFKKIRKYND